MDSLFPVVAIFQLEIKNKTKRNKTKKLTNKTKRKKKKKKTEELISMKRRLHAKRDKYAHEKRCSITFLNKTSRFFDLTDRHIFHDKSFLRSRRFIQDRDFFLWHHLEDGNRLQVGLLLRRNKSDFRSILSSYGLSYPKYPQYVVSLTSTKNRDHHFEIWSAGYTRRRYWCSFQQLADYEVCM